MRPKVNSLFTALAVFENAAEINICAVFYVFTAQFVTAATTILSISANQNSFVRKKCLTA